MERRLTGQGFGAAWLAGTEFQRYLRGESQKFSALAKKAGRGRPQL
jgi:hypothetical protein